MEKITVLILMANPEGTTALGLETELNKILEALNKSSAKLKFEVISCCAASTDELHDNFRMYQPQIVHFSGHGAGAKGLVFEDESKQPQLANSKALAGLFDLFEGMVECVILNACYSEVQAEEIHRYVNCVIGMKQAIGDKSAIQFASGFYKSLSAGDTFERAYKFGRNAIDFESTSESEIPVLKLKKRDAIPTPKSTAKPEPEVSSKSNSSELGSISANINMRDNPGQFVIGHGNTVSKRDDSSETL
jgi:CHAT domain